MKVQAQRALANPLVIYYYSDTKMIFIVFFKGKKVKRNTKNEIICC